MTKPKTGETWSPKNYSDEGAQDVQITGTSGGMVEFVETESGVEGCLPERTFQARFEPFCAMMGPETPNPKAKFGAQKPDLSLLPPVAKAIQALAHENGAQKYGPYNWRETRVEALTYISAAQRHLDNWLDGEENASDSDIHNLGHAIASLNIILDAQACGTLIDNRPLPGKSSQVQDRLKEWKKARQ